ncbi:MAG: RpiB/LacA/LacB family sugar-phosphate isomerase [Planctomycetota bacterium]|nr:RpiB/LacA/LacB family sugar-phosphate isomerase [Planctomycetota bacterium]
MNLDIRSIAMRAARRALADPYAPTARGGVVVLGSGARPLDPTLKAQLASARSQPWVTERCLDGAPNGSTVTLSPDVRVTALAREIAEDRGIRFRHGHQVQGTNFGGSHPPFVAVGCDHGGFDLKQEVMASLAELGYRPLDMGTRDRSAADYPDFARAVAEAVADGRAVLGVCIDGAGIGSAMTAGKVPGVLPANCWDVRTAANAREHNHANVLCLGAGHLDRSSAHSILQTVRATPCGEGRHARRVEKIWATETRYSKPSPEGISGA